MKIFNLLILISPLLFSVAVVTAQDKQQKIESNKELIDDSNTCQHFEKSYLNWADNRIILNDFDNCISTFIRNYPERGYTVQTDSKGRTNIYVWNPRFGYTYNGGQTPTKSEIKLPSKHHEEVLNQMVKHAEYLSQKNAVDAYNKGYAWRGGTSARPSTPNGNNNAYAQGRTQNYSPRPSIPSNPTPPRRNVTRSNGSHSGGTTPNNGGTSIRTGHTLSK